MSFNHNSHLPGYVESDVYKARQYKPPRNKRKEIDLYIYKTNKTIRELEELSGAAAVQVIKTPISLKTQITTKLNFDITSPKLPSISESQIWGSQINGIIYEDIDIDASKYTYATFSKETDQNIKTSAKYRIVNLSKVYNNKNEFLYATINMVQDSIKSIKSWENINWKLVGTIIEDKKTKYINITFDSRTFMYPNGLKIEGKKNKQDTKKISIGYGLWSSEALVLKLIKIRQTQPFLFDDLSLSDFNERKITDVDIKGQIKNESTKGSKVQIVVAYERWSPRGGNDNATKIVTPKKVGWTISPGNVTLVSAVFAGKNRVGPKDFLSEGVRLIHGNEKNPYIKENDQTPTEIQQFLSGTATADGFNFPLYNKIEIESNEKTIKDLDEKNENDRKTFVLSKPSDLSKYLVPIDYDFNFNQGNDNKLFQIEGKDNYPKTRLKSASEIETDFINNNKITFRITLQTDIYSPLINLLSSGGEEIQIETFDASHNQILASTTFNTSFAFNDGELLTEIQL